MSTRGLNQFVTLDRAGTHEGPRSARGHTPGAFGKSLRAGPPLLVGHYFLSPPLPSSPPPLMDS